MAGPQNRASHAAYRKAVESALREFGLEPRIIEGNNDIASGERAVPRLLTEKNFPTGLLSSNDLTAMGAMRAFFKCGLRVPSDVSVVGADDIPFCALTHPPLTTVRIPRERLGLLAFEVLQSMLTIQIGRGSSFSSAWMIASEPGLDLPGPVSWMP